MAALHEDVFTCVTISNKIILEWEIFYTKAVEKIKTHILCSITFLKRNSAVYEIMWDTPQTKIYNSACALRAG
jgi:hypothetical protein